MDRRSYKYLKKLYSNDYIPRKDFLNMTGYSNSDCGGDAVPYVFSDYVDCVRLEDENDNLIEHVFVLTPVGREYVEEHRRLTFNEFRAWFTLAIALAAFIKSFFC